MTTIRPLEPADLDAAARLRCARAVSEYLGENRFVRVSEIREKLASKAMLGAFRGGVLQACAQIGLSSRARSKHVGEVDLFCSPDGQKEAQALSVYVINTASHWLQLVKVELLADPEAPWLQSALNGGFQIEARRLQRRFRAGERRSDLLLGWTRPDYAHASLDHAPTLPVRGPRRQVHLRTPVADDAQAMAELHRQESVMRGTLQTPLRTTETWRQMISGTFTAASIAAEVDGSLVGSGALIRCDRPAMHTLSLGLAVSTQHQGCGVGTTLMAGLLAVARDDLAAHRVELEVDVENEAARALYRKMGFVDEGVRRAGSWRGDGYSDAMCMGLVFDP